MDDCSQTFRTYSGIVTHLRRKHRGRYFDDQPTTSTSHDSTMVLNTDISESETMEIGGGQVDQVTIAGTGQPEANRLERAAALFLLCLKERYQITQTAVDFAVSQVQVMLSFAVEDIERTIEMCLQSRFPEVTDFEDVMDCFRAPDPFMHLTNEYMQTKYYRDNFGLIVSINLYSFTHIHVYLHN